MLVKKNNIEPLSPLTSRWFWIVSFIYALLIIMEYIENYSLFLLGKLKSFEMGEVSQYVLPDYIIMLLLSPIIFWFYHRNKKKEFWKVWRKYLFISIFVGLLFGFLNRSYWLVNSFFTNTPDNTIDYLAEIKNRYRFIIPISFTGIIHFWALSILFFALDFYDQFKNQSYRALQLESQLTDSKLQNLRMQLNPHFLFNALNTVSMMVRKDKKSNAINMISGISDLLRSTLNVSNEQFITLREEIKLLRKYLHIEEQRFSDRLTIEFDIDEAIWNTKVPNLLLQPLVENAFKYGVAKNINEAYIKISAEEQNGSCQLKVFNKGNLLQQPFKEGIGLTNTRSRLEMSYLTYSFILTNAMDMSGVEAIIVVPLKYD